MCCKLGYEGSVIDNDLEFEIGKPEFLFWFWFVLFIYVQIALGKV